MTGLIGNRCRAKVTFSLNALRGRKLEKKNSTLWVGDWNKINAQEFMKYTISKGYKIDSYELGKYKQTSYLNYFIVQASSIYMSGAYIYL